VELIPVRGVVGDYVVVATFRHYEAMFAIVVKRIEGNEGIIRVVVRV